ncbi:anthranilate phosphoribosyltransferase [Bacillus haynesii]|uniref:anthranilate phosphoribosyltransferase n=1 Tax=Bacillus haynesii TaxID=1925021 RepID=UPI0022822126|nr:anthranilate phosphoribosyltransferase [Bacillus haynesii]MCY8006853.1 anthranilate phosphoribosyltransferase [Bacillus haynesii]MCY8345655.1 anthranilate phosphoribosyltransferase [Bacillus haynesii]MCY8349121.1 anthranilate phosphoribosyltransferase [Bacillus haynesii]MCY9370747.1 anthranilate phosphoribosyltransferase [Bacillus haynesii]MCY9399833.1 anthranilate phosphoribosyltransferase [Bacillus haynesii]
MQQWIKEVARGKRGARDLAYEEAKQAAEAIITGNASPAQTAAFLIAERIKTESPEELLAFTEALRNSSETLSLSKAVKDAVIDFAGPYTGRHSFLATIPVSLLLAGNGVPAFLHGSDALPPKYGTSIKDVLDKLGIPSETNLAQTAHSLEEASIGFAAAETFCKPFVRMRKIREEIGVRTVLNTAEKLVNFSDADKLMMGAFHRTAIQKMHPVFQRLTYKEVFIVQGAEGSEDVPVHRGSFVFAIKNGEIDSFILKPEEYGLYAEEAKLNKPLSAEEQAEKITAVLAGDESADTEYERKQVIMNTALRYYLFGHCTAIEEGVRTAEKQLKEKAGLEALERWKASFTRP